MTICDRKLIYPNLSYVITGICYEVQNRLGRYCKEKQYGDVLEKCLLSNKISYIRECGEIGSGNRLDFIIDGRIVLEIKARPTVGKNDYYQIQRYLQYSGLKLGLLINFRDKYLKCKRIVRIDTRNRSKYMH